jgi:surface antigen
MNTAAQQALASNRVQTWSNPQSGVSGQAVPVRAGGNCREVRQTITLEDGSPREETITACRGANGWEVRQT